MPKRSTDEDATRWLTEAPAQSAHALEMIAKPSTATSGWYKPNSVADFVAAQQHCLDNCKMLMLDPETRLEFDAPVVFTPRSSNFPTGLWAYGAQFSWKSDGTWDKTMITYRSEGAESQNLTLAGLSILGDQTGGAQPPALVLVRIEGRSNMPIRGFRFSDITWQGGCYGLWLEGEVFEGYVTNPTGSWTRHAGIVCRHGYDVPGVMSNVYIDRPNITRAPINMGNAMGILCDGCSSVMISDGNFISLDGPAIKGTNGVKRIVSCDFENTGNVNGAAIEIDANDFWSQVIMCEGSNTQGQMLYLLSYGGTAAALDLEHCRMYSGEVMAPESHTRCEVKVRGEN